MKIFPIKKFKDIIMKLSSNHEYLGTGDNGDLAFKTNQDGSFIVLSYDNEYIYCKTLR